MMRARGRKWSDLTSRQRVGALALIALQAILTAFAQRDLGTRSAQELRGPKMLWRVVTLNALGAVAYVLVGRRPS
jgi:hypothetical protein